MNEPTAIPSKLSVLRRMLDAVDGVRAEFASDSEVTVAFKGRRIGNWVPDGKSWESLRAKPRSFAQHARMKPIV